MWQIYCGLGLELSFWESLQTWKATSRDLIFRCGSNDDKALIRGKCYEQYEKQYHKCLFIGS